MHETYLTVFGITALLATTSLCMPLARKLNFPYTVLLAAVGIFLGAIVTLLGKVEGMGIAGDFVRALGDFSITSEVVFFIFLPTLIFESALSIDVRRLLDDIAPILLLAVVGLMISSFAIGGTVFSLSSQSFVVCLLLGAILSATDPVAVVAIFKDLGAPKRLAILVEGESLFNDATAIVLFTILSAIVVSGAEASLLSGFGSFLKVFLGGIIVGYFFARIVCWIIGRMRDVPLVEITLTLCLAYFAFVVAEHYLHVSGVMAVVTAALVVGSVGRTSIKPATWHGLSEVWEQIAFWANSLIFVVAGLLVPAAMTTFGATEFTLLAAIVVVAFTARSLIIFGVLPLLSRFGLGQQVSTAYKTVMMWGGLRGAVSLALALAIYENANVSEDVQNFILVLVTGFVLFTLFVNAPTMGFLISGFGLDKLSPADLAVRNRVMQRSWRGVKERIGGLANDLRVSPEFAREVAHSYDVRLREVERDLARPENFPLDDRMRMAMTTLLTRERQRYLKLYTQGFASSAIAPRLFARADDLLDAVKSNGLEG